MLHMSIISPFFPQLAMANMGICDSGLTAVHFVSVPGWTAAHNLIMCLKTNLECHIM